jgi:Dyp-type peroxidase family
MGDTPDEQRRLSATVQAAKQGPLFILPRPVPTREAARAAPLPPLDEPVLSLDDIQGNVLPGFNKDFQILAFLNIEDVAPAKAWLRGAAVQVSTAREVLRFNRLFRGMRHRRGMEPAGLNAVWMNLAFTFPGIEKLVASAAEFPEGAFRVGLPPRSAMLGDPQDSSTEGHPSHWVIGAEGHIPDILVIVAGDDAQQTEKLMARLLQWHGPALPAAGEHLPGLGLQVTFIEQGEVLPTKGHEHFGFKDGVSQPGVRGRATETLGDFVTPRYLPESYAFARYFGKPGQLLIWPGEFIIGYDRQHDKEPLEKRPALPPEPEWTRNGSFLVFRRLRQNVPAFQRFLSRAADVLRQIPGFEGTDEAWVGARLMGRWPSGAPVMRSPHADDPALGADDSASSHFFFAQEMPALTLPGDPPVTIPGCPADPAGFLCPHAGHIRKVNPRDISTDSGSSLNRRLLRRGVPYGPPHNPSDPASVDIDRGLLFLAYTASIEETFELLQQTWCNDTLQPRPGGHDPIIGQNPVDPARRRTFTLSLRPGVSAEIPVEGEWVIPTGGAYLFAPSISALTSVFAS